MIIIMLGVISDQGRCDTDQALGLHPVKWFVGLNRLTVMYGTIH